MNKQQHMLMKIIQKISVFEGLSIEEAQNVLMISKMRKMEAGEQIYGYGEKSLDMLVLIQGKLKVVSASGQDIVEISPGASIGEMGVFTGQPRSATIVAVDASLSLMIDRDRLQDLLKTELHMKATILENVVAELAYRLTEADQKLGKYLRDDPSIP
ncbi:MAG: cyclic nucleotide-binding domain-containing protein [bacterium]|nr:cyclic nucleotide-binding domain-containing protein [bacterium]